MCILLVDYILDITITRVDIRAVDRSTSIVIFSVSVSICIILSEIIKCIESLIVLYQQ